MALNRSSFEFQFGTQTAKGVYNANPAYFGEGIGGNLNPTRSNGELEIGGGNIWTPSYQWVDKIEGGGAPIMVAQPQMLGALLQATLGTDNKTGASDPYTHTITPYNGPAPWMTWWKHVDTLYEIYRDCKISSLALECSVTDKIVRVTPTILSAAKPIYKSAAPGTPATEESGAFDWYDAEGVWSVNGDLVNVVTAPIATDSTTSYTLVNSIKAKYNAHCAATGVHHKAADSITVTQSDATNLTSLTTLANDIKTKFNTHRASATYHYDADTWNNVASSNATDQATANVLVNEIKLRYNSHIGVIAAIKDFSLTVTRDVQAWYGESVSPYTLIDGKARVEVRATLLIEDLLYYNKVMYGAKTPVDGTEVYNGILTGNFHTKFSYQSATSTERSLDITIPTLQFAADAVEIGGDPSAGPIEIPVAGRAAGTAPIVTTVVTNSLSSQYT